MFPKMPDFTEGSFEFLRKLWESGLPDISRFAAPPMRQEDIDQRIRDLRAVENWLQINASLLRTAIQGLEIQRATLLALQTFGSAFAPNAIRPACDPLSASTTTSASPNQPAARDPGSETAPRAQAPAAASAVAASLDPSPWWNLLQQQFDQIASSTMSAMSQDSNGPGQAARESPNATPKAAAKRAKPPSGAATRPQAPARRAPKAATGKPLPQTAAPAPDAL